MLFLSISDINSKDYFLNFSRVNNYRLVFTWIRIQNIISRSTICKAHSILFKTIFQYLGYKISTEVFDLMHISKIWPIFKRFHGHYNIRFTLCPPTSLSWLWRAKVAIVSLYQTSKYLICILFRHCLSNLLTHSPNSLAAFDFQHPLQRKHRNAAILPAHQKDHPKPLP